MTTLLTPQQQITYRPRRNRRTPAIRSLTQETRLHPSDFVHSYFVIEGNNVSQPIGSMPGQARLSTDLLIRDAVELWGLGLRGINLFAAVPTSLKDPLGTEATNPEGVLQCAIRAIKEELPEMWVMADIALDPYTSHGHDGILDADGDVHNDLSVDALLRMALSVAEAGADMVAPSDMMDGRIGAIRNGLDEAGFTQVGILSYAAKYCSAFYGPFRDALSSAPKKGDKKSYQMNPANVREALLEAHLDEAEGADMLLVKPALPYLDVLCKLREAPTLPIGAYHVSGEYSMVKAAAANGWMDCGRALYESSLSIKRAGADFILGYAFRDVVPLIE